MPGASTGLQKALARAGGSVIAIAEMTADNLLAEMTDEQKADLSAKLTPAAPAGAAANAATNEGGDEPGEEPGAAAAAASDAAAAASANASERDRVKAVAKAVATDDACKGKADLALSMLADDDYATLSASGIVKLIGKQPAPSAGAEDGDAAARAEMREAINETGNSNIDANGGGKNQDKGAQASSVWDAATAKVFPNSTGK